MPNPSTGAPATDTGRRPYFQLPPESERRRKAARLLAMLKQWEAEDAANPDAEREWEELKAALNANRRATGERLLFPEDSRKSDHANGEAGS